MDKKRIAKLTSLVGALGGVAYALAEMFPQYASVFAAVAAIAGLFTNRPPVKPTLPPLSGRNSTLLLVLLAVPMLACGGSGLSKSLRDAHDRVDGYRQAIADECGTDFSQGVCAALADAYEEASDAYAYAVKVVAALEDGDATVGMAVRAVTEAEQAVARVRELVELLK